MLNRSVPLSSTLLSVMDGERVTDVTNLLQILPAEQSSYYIMAAKGKAK